MITFDAENQEKERVFNVALALMEEMGYERLGIRRICEEAGISVGKFYRYFNSKEQLLAYFYNQLEKRFRDEIYDKLEGLDVREQIVRFYTWYVQYMVSFGMEFVMNFFSTQNPILNTHVYNNEIIVITDELLGKAVQGGYVIPDGKSIRDISCDFCVMIKGIMFDWCVRRGEFDIAAYTEDLLRRSARGIMP